MPLTALRPGVRPVSAAIVALVACAALLRLFWSAGADALAAVRTSGPDSAADLLVAAAAGIGLVLVAWCALGIGLTVLAALPGAVGRVAAAASAQVTPAVVRRLAAGLVGTVVATAASPVAHADDLLPSPVRAMPISAVASDRAPDP